MRKAVETSRMAKLCRTNLFNLQKVNAESDSGRKRWVQKYSQRILRQWLRWQTPLGIGCTYIEQIEEDLAKFYDEPLKKIFIETTYH